jgi:hypothetical protein
MKSGERFLRGLGFKPIVKIPGKELESLTQSDFVLLVGDYLDGKDENFDPNAIYEALDTPICDPGAETLRQKVIEIDADSRSDDYPDGLASPEGRLKLGKLIGRL